MVSVNSEDDDGVERLANGYVRFRNLATNLGISGLSDVGLAQALTHRSYCAEHPGVSSNERLEFLGDSVLGAVVGKYIFDTFSTFEEGELTKLRASVVSAHNLGTVARSIDLGNYLLLGRGEEASGGRNKNSILSDALEAVLGAIYLELGFDEAERVILMLMRSQIEEFAEGPGYSDFKSRLQELLAQLAMTPPQYELEWSGPDHARVFRATVRVADVVLGTGSGSSKKLAEQEAAQNALRVVGPAQAADQDFRSPG